MDLTLYFDLQTNCLTGINLNRPPAENEYIIEYEGEPPPLGYTFRYDPEQQQVLVVPEEECIAAGSEEEQPLDRPLRAQVWLQHTIRLPNRGSFAIPFDTKWDPHGIIKDLSHRVAVVGPGHYHIWGSLSYEIQRHFGILNRELTLVVNGQPAYHYSLSTYTRSRISSYIGPVYVELEEDVNTVAVLCEALPVNYRGRPRYYCYPTVVLGNRSRTYLYLVKLPED